MLEKNYQNAKNCGKQMRPFGSLKWSQWIQKKCCEQLRSSYIDGLCQMVRTGTRKMQNGSICFWISDHHTGTILLTIIFSMFWVFEWLWKIKIPSRKSILVNMFINTILILEHWPLLILTAKFCVLHLSRFCFKKIISVHFLFVLLHFRFMFVILKSFPILIRTR